MALSREVLRWGRKAKEACDDRQVNPEKKRTEPLRKGYLKKRGNRNLWNGKKGRIT